MSTGKPAPLVIHGWTVFAHPLFLAQIEALAQQVEALKQKDRFGYVKKNASKRLAAITKLAFDVVPPVPEPEPAPLRACETRLGSRADTGAYRQKKPTESGWF